MSRYIDADALIKEQWWVEIQGENIDDIAEQIIRQCKQIVKDAPTIDIVKCVDCRKCKEQGGHANCNGYLYCTRQKTMVDEDCFCSWGERSE